MRAMPTLAELQATEARILALAGSPVDHGDYRVARSERHPKWYQVNRLELRRPSGRSLADWEGVFREHFDARLHPHIMLHIPQRRGFDALLAEIEHAAENLAGRPGRPMVEHDTYMFADRAPDDTALPDNLEVRPVETEQDWQDLIGFGVEESREAPWFTNEADVRSFIESRRETIRPLGVRWLRLCPAGERTILARMGYFEHDGMARLQSVGTRRDQRRQGLASALLRVVLRETIVERSLSGVALSVETGTGAQSLYAGVGFRPVGEETWVLRLPNGG